MDIGALLAQDSQRFFLIELAGLFWLAAEGAILAVVLAARRHVQEMPHASRLRIDRADIRRIAGGAAAIGLLLGIVLAHNAIGNPHSVFQTMSLPLGTEEEALLQGLWLRQAILHHLMWVTFCTGWVLLEAAIVYHGCRTYGALRRLLGSAPPRMPGSTPMAGAILLGLAIGIALTSQTSEALAPAPGMAPAWYVSARLQDEPYRNAVMLYLRVAGIAWIFVEWVAAWALIRSYSLLRNALPEKGGANG